MGGGWCWLQLAGDCVKVGTLYEKKRKEAKTDKMTTKGRSVFARSLWNLRRSS